MLLKHYSEQAQGDASVTPGAALAARRAERREETVHALTTRIAGSPALAANEFEVETISSYSTGAAR